MCILTSVCLFVGTKAQIFLNRFKDKEIEALGSCSENARKLWLICVGEFAGDELE